MAEIFGYEIKRKAEPKKISFVPPDDEGVGNVINAGGHYGQYIDMDGGQAKSENDQIMKYRDAAMHPEVDAAIEDIINEAIVTTTAEGPVAIILEDIDQPATIKNKIRDEFYKIVELMNMNFQGSDIFRKWYVDGRLYYHKIIDTANPKGGIIELRMIDPLKIKKVREVQKDKDKASGETLIKGSKEYYVFQNQKMNTTNQGLRITKDAIAYCTSGLFSSDHKKVVSYLHKSLKTLNQLKMMEDSLVIYRLSRAPERRIFYIDVGNLPKGKAEEYLKNIMSKYRNKLVYNATTGEIKDHAKQMSMLEDFWLPRREGGRGTEITTLPGGNNLGEIDDIKYFQKKLYQSLNVPFSRLDSEASGGLQLGKTTEVSRDEIKFTKFIQRLRKKFIHLFSDMLKTQLILKGIVSEEDWSSMQDYIKYDFIQDGYFSEMKEQEIRQSRLDQAERIFNQQMIGKIFSMDYVLKNVLRMTDLEVEHQREQIKKEIEDGLIKDPYNDDANNNY